MAKYIGFKWTEEVDKLKRYLHSYVKSQKFKKNVGILLMDWSGEPKLRATTCYIF